MSEKPNTYVIEASKIPMARLREIVTVFEECGCIVSLQDSSILYCGTSDESSTAMATLRNEGITIRSEGVTASE